MTMAKERFDLLAQRGADMLLAAKMTGRLVAYEGTLQGRDVVILGAHWPEDQRPGEGMAAKPIALLVDEDVFELLAIDGEKVHLVDNA